MIFLDIGAHEGQTLEEVTKPKYQFDRIFAFEPMPVQFKKLLDNYWNKASLCNFGLADSGGDRDVYGANEGLEASIYAAKRDADENVVTRCRFMEASRFFKLMIPDTAIVKLNCEGAEIPILNNLIDTGEIWKVSNVMIDFDIRKVTGMEGEEAKLRQRLDSIGFDRYCLCDDVMVGETHQDRIANWLRQVL